MTKILKGLIQFFVPNSSVSTGLDAYITSKQPTNAADVERLTRQYMDRGVCGRLF
jgi:hypothetical protein